MDNPSMPWSLIGISDEARKIIRLAAAESGQTIGQWLNDRILRAAAPQTSVNSGSTVSTSGEDQAALEVLQRMQQALADAETFSAHEIETYQIALEELSRRVALLEATENKG